MTRKQSIAIEALSIAAVSIAVLAYLFRAGVQ